jgi:hypothetical protein
MQISNAHILCEYTKANKTTAPIMSSMRAFLQSALLLRLLGDEHKSLLQIAEGCEL